MATASSAERYAGDHCKKLGLSINRFYSTSQVMKITNITRRVQCMSSAKYESLGVLLGEISMS